MALVTKKDGTTGFCIDYRKLQEMNDVTRKDAYPLSRIDNTLDALRGSTYFSILDLYSGYWQEEMDEQDFLRETDEISPQRSQLEDVFNLPG